jgi:hypothetical protein
MRRTKKKSRKAETLCFSFQPFVSCSWPPPRITIQMAEENRRYSVEFTIFDKINLFLCVAYWQESNSFENVLFFDMNSIFSIFILLYLCRVVFTNPNQIKCTTCGKTVYPLEKVSTREGDNFHKVSLKTVSLSSFDLIVICFLLSGLFSLRVVWRDIKNRILYLCRQKILLQATSGSSETNNRVNNWRNNRFWTSVWK